VKQLEYFQLRNREISCNQQGLVDVIGGLSRIIAQAYASRTQHTIPSRPPSLVPNDDQMDVDNELVHIAHEGDGGQLPNAPEGAMSPIESSVHDECYMNIGTYSDHGGPSRSYVNIAGEDFL
jgi:hypothetical protein